VTLERRCAAVTRRGFVAGIAGFVVCASGFSGPVWAFKVDTGNRNLKLSWDNTLTYNVGVRVQAPDPTIYRNPSYQGADLKFGQGAINTNRLDVLSEVDVDYRDKIGFRVSGSGWYDQAFHSGVSHAEGNADVPNLACVSTPAYCAPGGLPQTYSISYSELGAYTNNEYSSYTKRWYGGPSAELLDAFLYSNVNIAGVPVNIKAGRYNLYWGESLFNLADSIAYSQSPVDLRKAAAAPGTPAKVLFLPLTQLSATAQLAPELAWAAQYYLEWEQSRFPEAGTYFGGPDVTLNGPDRLLEGAVPNPSNPTEGVPLFLSRIGIDKPHNKGGWGSFLRWSPTWMAGGTAGLYVRKFDETVPWLLPGPSGAAAPQYYHAVYPRGTMLYGMSLSSNIGGASVSAEASFRHHTGLATGFAPISEGARGDTASVLVNAIELFSQNSLWSTLVLDGEIVWNHFVDVRSHADELNMQGYACSDRLAGCATRNYLGFQMAADPSWVQVFPGIDFEFPMSFGMGLYGNSVSVSSTDQAQGSGSYSFGPKVSFLTKYSATFAYNGFFSHYNTQNGVITTGDGAVSNDRGWVSMTIQGAF